MNLSIGGGGKTSCSKGFRGFTLAEVLITLGIIGVVAAMTLPMLMANHRKQVTETRLAKFYSVINQAIKMAEVDYEDKKVWGDIGSGFELDENEQPTTNSIPLAWVNKYIMPYLNGAESYALDTGHAVIKFSDGSLAILSKSSVIFYPDAKNFKSDLADKEGSGIVFFNFLMKPNSNTAQNALHYDKGVEPYAFSAASLNPDDISVLKNDENYGCKEELPRNGRAYCTRLIQLNGWKIPKDYPLKF